MDVDRWSKESLNEIYLYCKENKNWNIALSNPCFEVWLYFHKRHDFSTSLSRTCKDLKNEISTFEIGGYKPHNFIPDLKNAIKNSKEKDSNKTYYLPKKMETKVYKLFESLMKKVGEADFISFIEKINS